MLAECKSKWSILNQICHWLTGKFICNSSNINIRGEDCDKDVCYHWKTSSHKDCYNLDQFSKAHYEGAESEPGFIASSLNFVNGLCGGGRREEDMRGFNLMTFIISRE